MNNKVWLITGTSQGLGLCLVRRLLAEGYQVAATTRVLNNLTDVIGGETEHFLPLEMQLTDEKSVQAGKEKILEKFGTVDVIVNNAGYAQRGMLEEVSDTEARNNFDANVFSVLNIIRNFAGVLREKRNGYIINISSIVGLRAGTWSGIYSATKFAVEGISEALRGELAPYNVKVITAKPGDMRTGFHKPETLKIAKTQIEDYSGLREQARTIIRNKNGNQCSSPEKVAQRIIEITQMEQPPLNVFFGNDSFEIAESKVSLLQKEMAEGAWIAHSVSVDE